MKIKELIKQLKELNPENDIYIIECLELYKPILQIVWDAEKQEDFILITKERKEQRQ